MNRLSTYVLAIQSHHPLVYVVSYTEQRCVTINVDEFIEEKNIVYTFNNDVRVLYQTELDSFKVDPECQECQECWISYQVLDMGKQAISPKKKQFYNHCQEAFWIKMQSIHEGQESLGVG